MSIVSPTITLHPLHRADGSATYIHTPTRTHIICGVNFPIEAPPRSSLPDDCYIEVHIRPAAGVGGVKERHLETLVASTLRAVVLGEGYPRGMVQITLQVLSQQGGDTGQGGSYLRELAGLVNAAMGGCLDAGVEMKGTVVATTVAVMKDGEVRAEPAREAMGKARSLHVLGFSREGECVLVESEGRFGVEEWETVVEEGRKAALSAGGIGKGVGDGEDVDMDVQDGAGGMALQEVLRKALKTKVAIEERWRG